MEKVGKIKAISEKDKGRVAFCLEDSDTWYWGYQKDMTATKGDNVSFSVTVNGNFSNFKDMVKLPDTSDNFDKQGNFNQQFLSQKDINITAQCLVKAWCSAAPVDLSKEDVLEAYQFFVNKL